MVLEEIPFPIGYGVETGMLIDIYQKWGLEVMAQTDLAQRVHRNQPTTALGRMAFGIMQTFWDRLHKYKGQGPLEPESLLFRTIASSEEGAYSLEEGMVQEKERRPMIEVAEYRRKYGRERSSVEASAAPSEGG